MTDSPHLTPSLNADAAQAASPFASAADFLFALATLPELWGALCFGVAVGLFLEGWRRISAFGCLTHGGIRGVLQGGRP